jgi:hypothetical protein
MICDRLVQRLLPHRRRNSDSSQFQFRSPLERVRFSVVRELRFAKVALVGGSFPMDARDPVTRLLRDLDGYFQQCQVVAQQISGVPMTR